MTQDIKNTPPRPSRHASQADTRVQIINAAKKVFAQKGFDGATIKDLSDAAGTNVSLISYYFGGKEGLYQACIEHFGQTRLELAQKLLKAPESAEDFRVKLRLFIEQVYEAHLEEPEVMTIIHREISSDLVHIRDVFDRFFGKLAETLTDFVRGAQKQGLINVQLSPEIVASFIHGGVIHFGRCDAIISQKIGKSLENSEYRKQIIETIMTVLTKGLL